MHELLDRAVSIALIVAALVFSATLLDRQFFSADGQVARLSTPPTFETSWNEVLPHAIRVGPSEARVSVIELVDFECPACASTDPVLDAVRDAFAQDVAIHYVHYPIPSHPYALQAAHAIECATTAGHFNEMKDAIYSEQRWLGLITWVDFAVKAGIQDTAQFQRCIDEQHHASRIEAGMRFGDAIQITGTPTVLINGWKLTHMPSVEQFGRLIEAILAGALTSDSRPEFVGELLASSGG